jgi:protein-disulfide isomerase
VSVRIASSLVVVFAIAVAVITAAHADRPRFDPAAIYQVPAGASPSTGPADAPITIVSWSDFACGYCYRAQFTIDALDRLYPGQIRWVHRYMPLDGDHGVAAEAALAAAAQGRLRPMSDRIYAVGGRIDRAGLELFARELGLDLVRFRAELDTGAHRTQIDADVTDAASLGISGTPSFFVNGRSIHGHQPVRVFAEVIDEELARHAQHVKAGDASYEALVAGGLTRADVLAPERQKPELDAAETYRVGLGLPGHQLGPDTALVTIVAWGDFQCPYCARSHGVLRQIRAKYGDDVRIVYRHFAMRGHPRAALAAEAAVAAAVEGKFWAFHDRLFDQFDTLTRPELEQHAQAVGLDPARFREALDTRRYRDLVAAETAAGQALGVDATPTMFVNGRPIVGSLQAAKLEQIIDEHLDKARLAVKGGIAARDVYALFMAGAAGADRADPSRVPVANVVTLRAGDRSRAVAAACRARDGKRARQLADGLTGAPLRHAKLVCAAGGIDL